MRGIAVPAVEARALSKLFHHRGARPVSLKERVLNPDRRRPESFWAIRDATFDVPQGSTLGIIGPNGSGKSTLLKVLAGIYRPTAGTVRVRGRVSALLELGAGFHPDLTGRENIQVNGAVLGLSRPEISRAVPEIIEMSGIGDFIDDPVRMYSSGMRMRLGFSVAVTVNPDVLIVDEVIAVGDESFRAMCLDHFERIRDRGATVVIVSHALGLIRDLCDTALLLRHGGVEQIGPAAQVVEAYVASVSGRSGACVREGTW